MSNKRYFFSLKDYCDEKRKNIDENSCFEYIQHSIKLYHNPKLEGYVRTIQNTDNLYEVDDIVSECYIYCQNRDLNDFNIIHMKNYIINIYDKVNAKKRKCLRVGEIEIDDTPCDNRNIDSDIFINNLLDTLDDEERKLIHTYFMQGYSFSEIGNKIGISKMGVKYKIDKILKKLRDTL